MSEELDYTEETDRTERPKFLLVLCILSFVYIGWSLITGLISLVSGPMGEEELLNMRVELTKSMNEMHDLGMKSLASFFDKMIHLTESTNAAHHAVASSNIVILLIGLLGTIWMLRGKKLGFHLYIIYSLLASVQIYFFVSAVYVPTFLIVFSLIISGLFIFMYSRNLKWMK